MFKEGGWEFSIKIFLTQNSFYKNQNFWWENIVFVHLLFTIMLLMYLFRVEKYFISGYFDPIKNIYFKVYFLTDWKYFVSN